MSQRGLSLVETLLALGMMSLVATVLVTIQATSQQSIVDIERFSNVTAVILNIQRSITDSNMYMPPLPRTATLNDPAAIIRCYSDKGELVDGVTEFEHEECWYYVKFVKSEVRDQSFPATDPLSRLPISKFLFSIQYYRGNRAELNLPADQREGNTEVIEFTRLKTGHITD